MNYKPAKPPSRLVIIGGLLAAGIIVFFVLLPCSLREINSRVAVGRDIAMWHRVRSAVYAYHQDHGAYPASLDTADFQPYIDGSLAAYLREGRLAYYPPTADSPSTFILIQMTTPRGNYSIQLDGTPVYPHSK